MYSSCRAHREQWVQDLRFLQNVNTHYEPCPNPEDDHCPLFSLLLYPNSRLPHSSSAAANDWNATTNCTSAIVQPPNFHLLLRPCAYSSRAACIWITNRLCARKLINNSVCQSEYQVHIVSARCALCIIRMKCSY